MFSQRRVAQMAAYLLGREKGRMNYLKLIKLLPHRRVHRRTGIRRRMNYLKLIKLLYLADRESMKRYDHPISSDHYVSMDHGPVLSKTFDLIIKGAGKFAEQDWNYWIADKADYDVELKRKASREALDELSDANLDVLSDIYAKFGKMNEWKLVDYTHRYCREWTDPKGSSIPIEYEDIFKAFGRTPAEARRLGARLEQQRKIDRLFATL